MKKLLALILCVMMFVAVIPTAAFAGGLPVDNPLLTAKDYQKHIENMIKNTKTSVENSYKSLVGDQVVYTSAKAMDDSVVSLVDAIANPLIEKGEANKAWADACKDAIRVYLDKAVATKIVEDYYKALDKDGNRDELKYAQLIANSINSALTDKDFVAGYQAVATNFALRALVSDMSKEIKDQYKAFAQGVDSAFEKKFAEKYTILVDDYIDTLATGAAKAANNAAAWDALQDAIEAAEDAAAPRYEYAQGLYDQRIATAKTTRDGAATTEKANLKTAKDDLEAAEKALAQAKLNPTSTEAQIKAAEADVKAKETAVKTAQKAYDAKVKAANKQYDEDVETAEAWLTYDQFNISYDYNKAVDAAEDVYEDALEVINPWALYDLPGVGSWS